MRYIVLIFLLLITGPALASDLTDEIAEKCKIKLVKEGIHYTYCPEGTVMDANSTTVNTIGTTNFVYDRLRCVRPVIVCTEETEE